MKQLLLALLCLGPVQATLAQNISIGARTGVGNVFTIGNKGYWQECAVGSPDISTYQPFAGKVWDKNLFVNYRTNGRYAMELSFTQHTEQISYSSYYSSLNSSGPIRDINTTVNEQVYNFGLSFLYDVSLNCLKKDKTLQKFRPYLGVGIVARYSNIHYRDEINTSGQISGNEFRIKELKSTMLTANYQLVYALSTKMNLSLAAYLGLVPGELYFGDERPFLGTPANAKAGLQAGVSYYIH